MDWTSFGMIAALSLAVSAISVTLSKAGVFQSLRDWITSRNAWLGKLISCHYCTSHWVSFIMVLVYQPRICHAWLPFDLIVSAFVMVGIAAPIMGIVVQLYGFGPPPRADPEEDESPMNPRTRTSTRTSVSKLNEALDNTR